MRRIFTPDALRMRIASSITAEPAALSVAPVPLCQPSKCAPSMTISSALSVPGISAMTLIAVLVLGHRVLDRQLDADRHVLLEHAREPAVVLDGDHDGRRNHRREAHEARRALRVVDAALLHEDRAAVAAPRLEHRQHAFVLQELQALRR